MPGRPQPASKWHGRARSISASSAFSAQPPFPRGSGGGNGYRRSPSWRRSSPSPPGAAPRLALLNEGAVEAGVAAHVPQHADFYTLGPGAVFAVFREGDDLFGQLT